MKYLGCIQQKEFEALSSDKQLEFLLSKGIMIPVERVILRKGVISRKMMDTEATKLTEPNKQVVAECYEFILQQYEHPISVQLYDFYLGFNEEIYGLKKSKQKQIALEHFKNHFEAIATKIVSVAYERQLESGVTILESMAKLEFLKAEQNALKYELSKTTLLNHFLYGNTDFFTRMLPKEYKIIADIIRFEGGYKILSSLHSQYHFEVNSTKQPLKKKNTLKRTQNTTNTSKKATKNTLNNTPLTHEKGQKHPLNEEWKKTTNIKTPLISDKEAIAYLLKTVFTKTSKTKNS